VCNPDGQRVELAFFVLEKYPFFTEILQYTISQKGKEMKKWPIIPHSQIPTHHFFCTIL
jgi:hypothetical protein